MTEIEKTKKEIEVLTKKLSFLEELERTKTPCEEAFKRVYGFYPETYEDSWSAFQAGYIASQEDYKVGEFQPTPQEPTKDWESKPSMINCFIDGNPPNGYVSWSEWFIELGSKGILHNLKISSLDGNDYKPVPHTTEELLKSNWKPSAQTPEQVEEGLRDAMRTAKKEGVFDTTKESWMNKPVEELVEMLEKNPPDCLKFVMGKTLEDIVTQWWCDTFTGTHEKWSMEECIDDLIDQIELFLPRSQSSEGTQSVYTEVAVEAHNELLQKIKSKLRNKKDT
jgi:hypothetical protein